MVNFDTPFRQQLLHVSVGESIAQVPSDCHHDHLRWEAETGEARPRHGHSGKTTTHQPSLPACGDPPMQQTLLRLCCGFVSAESSDRDAVQTWADCFLDEPRRWSAIQSIGSKLSLLHRGAEAAAHLWWLLGALR
jgi:hypothetical protein